MTETPPTDPPAETPPSSSEQQKTTLGTSSLEAPPTAEGVPVPRVGTPDPTPDTPAVGSLEPVSQGTLEAAAAADLEARKRADEQMLTGPRLEENDDEGAESG